MKLLFDQNISHRLVDLLASVYPGCSHLRHWGLDSADDETVWNFARQNSLMIVSKDSDFLQHCFLRGFPPKVIWIRLGNGSTDDIERVLRQHQNEVQDFYQDPIQDLLVKAFGWIEPCPAR